MLEAKKEKLQSFLQGNTRYIIPFFQRAYVWKYENWDEFWENIKEEFLQLIGGQQQSEHFIGTLIIKQKSETTQVGTVEYDLIDGQQRLTTICLLLRALYDFIEDKELKFWIKNFFIYKDSYGKEIIRIEHSRVDSKYFQNILQSDTNNKELLNEYVNIKEDELEKKLSNINNNINACYIFFMKKLEIEFSTSSNDDNIRKYISIILEKLPVIHMALSPDDDVQQIFDTINSLGVTLTTGELLKNYLFNDNNAIENYTKYWLNVFEKDEEEINFWSRKRSSGRIFRTTLELFLYSFLVILKETNVRMDKLFKEFKIFLKDKNASEIKIFTEELHDYASIFRNLPDGENLAEISFSEHDKRFFHLIREFEINTILPLILYIFKNVQDTRERNNILNLFESFIARRTICKMPTKNYNNFFLSLLKSLKEQDVISAQSINDLLLKYTDNTNKFPTDIELSTAFKESILPNKYTREVLFFIALYHLNNSNSDVNKLNLSGFSVEHIMPKKWTDNWNKSLSEEQQMIRNKKILSLGNLTLIKGSLNSKLRNSSWKDKKVLLTQYSLLKQTTDYLNLTDWNENEIDKRTDNLFNIAKEIWKR